MKKLKEIYGDRLGERFEEILIESIDASGYEGDSSAVVYPKNDEEIYKTVRDAIRYSYKIVPRGYSTNILGSSIPLEKNAIVMDFTEMDKIKEISEEKGYAIIEPGITLSKLNEKLKERGMFFPVHSYFDEITTIGGILSMDFFGKNSRKYGKLSDWVEELKIVDGKSMNRSVKGKEIELIIGSEGTLCLIYEVKIKIEKIKNTELKIFSFSDIDSLLTKYKYLNRIKEGIISIEYLDDYLSKGIGLTNGFALIVEYEEGLTLEEDGSNIIENISQETIKKFIHFAYSEGRIVMEDVKVKDNFSNLLRWLNVNGIMTYCCLTSGIVHPFFRKRDKELVKETFSLIKKLEGSCIGEFGYGLRKKDMLDEEQKKYLESLKIKYDSRSIINPGKLIQITAEKGEIENE